MSEAITKLSVLGVYPERTLFRFTHKGDGWCSMFIDASTSGRERSTVTEGYFTALTSEGSFGHHWSSISVPEELPDYWGNYQHVSAAAVAVLRFLAGAKRDPSYFASKVGLGAKAEFDPEGTVEAIRSGLIHLRRRGDLDAHQAREDWDAAGSIRDEFDFYQWTVEANLDSHVLDPFEFACVRQPPKYRRFVDRYLAGSFAQCFERTLANEWKPVDRRTW